MLYLDEKNETSKMKLQNHEGGLLIESGPPGRDSKQQYSEHQKGRGSNSKAQNATMRL